MLTRVVLDSSGQSIETDSASAARADYQTCRCQQIDRAADSLAADADHLSQLLSAGEAGPMAIKKGEHLPFGEIADTQVIDKCLEV